MAGVKKKEVPLSNLGAEKAALGALLRSPHTYWEVADNLKSDYFTTSFHRELYSVLTDVVQTTSSVSMAVLLSRLPAELDDGQDTALYLAALAHNAEGLNVSDFCDQIAEAASRRQLLNISEAISRAAKLGDKQAIDVAGEAELSLLDVMKISSPKRPKRMSEVVTRVIAAANSAHQHETGVPGIGTGLRSLDGIMGKMLPVDLIFLLASQSDGKTALAAQIAMHAAHSGPVLFIQMEMSDEQIAARELAAASGIPVRNITEGEFDEYQFGQLRDAAARLETPELWILDASELTVRQIRSHALAMRRSIGLVFMVIDQLDKIKDEYRTRDRFERFTNVTRDLKVMVKELLLPTMVLAQRTRGAQRREDATPDVLDADAPSIERDADVVIGLWREETFLRRHKPPASAGAEAHDAWYAKVRQVQNLAKVICLKRRRGQPFEECVLQWNGALTRFSELV